MNAYLYPKLLIHFDLKYCIAERRWEIKVTRRKPDGDFLILSGREPFLQFAIGAKSFNQGRELSHLVSKVNSQV